MQQTIQRIEEICQEFDSRLPEVGLAIARLELAKALAEAEKASPDVVVIEPSGPLAICRKADYDKLQDGITRARRIIKMMLVASHPWTVELIEEASQWLKDFE
jgi:translation initiation factor IF-3